MPKVDKKKTRTNKKKTEKLQSLRIEQNLKIIRMYKSAGITYFLTLIMLTLSVLFNGEYIPLNFGDSTGAKIGAGIVKALPVIFFFFLALVSVGNYQEMRGYIATWKELTGIFILSILLATSDKIAFLSALIGILLMLTYLYFIQPRAETEA